jgi:hypothetical protein
VEPRLGIAAPGPGRKRPLSGKPTRWHSAAIRTMSTVQFARDHVDGTKRHDVPRPYILTWCAGPYAEETGAGPDAVGLSLRR